MNKKTIPAFKKCAQGLMALALDATGHDLVYQELARRDAKLKNMTCQDFGAEYVPVKLALGCFFWTNCCEIHNIADKETRNIYFKEVMNLFEGPRSLGSASRFSESLYAANADKENSPILGIMVHLFHKLKLTTLGGPENEDEKSVSQGLCFMMEVSDAFKTVFEDRFNDFIYQQNDGMHA
ncbi:MAG TPA: hypothetical protein PLO78_07630 [Candidatus Omnitrophota bacterium]|nr:hypothetical protein [Candidatus Omnitrophota bacterium]